MIRDQTNRDTGPGVRC